MGAIILEMIICLLYGHNQLDILHAEIQRYYVDGGTEDGRSTARIHPEVERWIGHMYRDPRCGTESNPTAIRRLLKLVHERLLIVHVRQETVGGDTQSLILQSDVLEVRLEAPSEDISPYGPSSSNIPSIEVEGESAENMSSISRADSTELLQAIHAIRESCSNTALPYYCQLRPDQSYAGPRPSHGNSLTVPGQARNTKVLETTSPKLSRSLQPPQSLQPSQVSIVANFTSAVVLNQC